MEEGSLTLSHNSHHAFSLTDWVGWGSQFRHQLSEGLGSENWLVAIGSKYE